MVKERFLDRFNMMLDTAEINKISNARVIVFGIGGVGGALTKMLVRSGIKHLTIVDFDSITVSNINRQVVANFSSIGKLKVDEMEIQLKNINPSIDLIKLPIKLDESTINNFDFSQYDYVIDCIDDLNAKKLLIERTYYKNIPILSAMGAGNRYLGIPHFKIADINKTSYDPIAKILRKFCSQKGIKKLYVCFTEQKPVKFDCKTIGSVIYYVVNMATIMCAKVINDIIK